MTLPGHVTAATLPVHDPPMYRARGWWLVTYRGRSVLIRKIDEPSRHARTTSYLLRRVKR